MFSRYRRPRLVCAIIGAQALALGAFAQQTPDTYPTQRPGDQTTPRAAETDAATRDMDRMSDRASDDRHAMDHSKMEPVTAQSFAKKAATIDKAEIELAQLALDNTKNEEIRIYAERLVKDHTATSKELKEIAAQENIQLPDSLDAKHQAVKQKLAGLKDDAFDREYKKHMQKGHDEAIALFKSASQSEQMPEDLKEFAASTLPALEKHKDWAKDLDMIDRDR